MQHPDTSNYDRESYYRLAEANRTPRQRGIEKQQNIAYQESSSVPSYPPQQSIATNLVAWNSNTRNDFDKQKFYYPPAVESSPAMPIHSSSDSSYNDSAYFSLISKVPTANVPNPNLSKTKVNAELYAKALARKSELGLDNPHSSSSEVHSAALQALRCYSSDNRNSPTQLESHRDTVSSSVQNKTRSLYSALTALAEYQDQTNKPKKDIEPFYIEETSLRSLKSMLMKSNVLNSDSKNETKSMEHNAPLFKSIDDEDEYLYGDSSDSSKLEATNIQNTSHSKWNDGVSGKNSSNSQNISLINLKAFDKARSDSSDINLNIQTSLSKQTLATVEDDDEIVVLQTCQSSSDKIKPSVSKSSSLERNKRDSSPPTNRKPFSKGRQFLKHLGSSKLDSKTSATDKHLKKNIDDSAHIKNSEMSKFSNIEKNNRNDKQPISMKFISPSLKKTVPLNPSSIFENAERKRDKPVTGKEDIFAEDESEKDIPQRSTLGKLGGSSKSDTYKKEILQKSGNEFSEGNIITKRATAPDSKGTRLEKYDFGDRIVRIIKMDKKSSSDSKNPKGTSIKDKSLSPIYSKDNRAGYDYPDKSYLSEYKKNKQNSENQTKDNKYPPKSPYERRMKERSRSPLSPRDRRSRSPKYKTYEKKLREYSRSPSGHSKSKYIYSKGRSPHKDNKKSPSRWSRSPSLDRYHRRKLSPRWSVERSCSRSPYHSRTSSENYHNKHKASYNRSPNDRSIRRSVSPKHRLHERHRSLSNESDDEKSVESSKNRSPRYSRRDNYEKNRKRDRSSSRDSSSRRSSERMSFQFKTQKLESQLLSEVQQEVARIIEKDNTSILNKKQGDSLLLDANSSVGVSEAISQQKTSIPKPNFNCDEFFNIIKTIRKAEVSDTSSAPPVTNATSIQTSYPGGLQTPISDHSILQSMYPPAAQTSVGPASNFLNLHTTSSTASAIYPPSQVPYQNASLMPDSQFSTANAPYNHPISTYSQNYMQYNPYNVTQPPFFPVPNIPPPPRYIAPATPYAQSPLVPPETLTPVGVLSSVKMSKKPDNRVCSLKEVPVMALDNSSIKSNNSLVQVPVVYDEKDSKFCSDNEETNDGLILNISRNNKREFHSTKPRNFLNENMEVMKGKSKDNFTTRSLKENDKGDIIKKEKLENDNSSRDFRTSNEKRDYSDLKNKKTKMEEINDREKLKVMKEKLLKLKERNKYREKIKSGNKYIKGLIKAKKNGVRRMPHSDMSIDYEIKNSKANLKIFLTKYNEISEEINLIEQQIDLMGDKTNTEEDKKMAKEKETKRDREKERDKVQERERDKVQERERDKMQERERDKMQERERDKVHEREKYKEKPQKKIRYIDCGSYWCDLCNDVFNTTSKLLEHMHKSDHLQLIDTTVTQWPQPIEEYERGVEYTDMSLKGIQFITPVSGYYCSICKECLPDQSLTDRHLKSKEHNECYMKYADEHPDLTQKYESRRSRAVKLMEMEKKRKQDEIVRAAKKFKASVEKSSKESPAKEIAKVLRNIRAKLDSDPDDSEKKVIPQIVKFDFADKTKRKLIDEKKLALSKKTIYIGKNLSILNRLSVSKNSNSKDPIKSNSAQEINYEDEEDTFPPNDYGPKVGNKITNSNSSAKSDSSAKTNKIKEENCSLKETTNNSKSNSSESLSNKDSDKNSNNIITTSKDTISSNSKSQAHDNSVFREPFLPSKSIKKNEKEVPRKTPALLNKATKLLNDIQLPKEPFTPVQKPVSGNVSLPGDLKPATLALFMNTPPPPLLSENPKPVDVPVIKKPLTEEEKDFFLLGISKADMQPLVVPRRPPSLTSSPTPSLPCLPPFPPPLHVPPPVTGMRFSPPIVQSSAQDVSPVQHPLPPNQSADISNLALNSTAGPSIVPTNSANYTKFPTLNQSNNFYTSNKNVSVPVSPISGNTYTANKREIVTIVPQDVALYEAQLEAIKTLSTIKSQTLSNVSNNNVNDQQKDKSVELTNTAEKENFIEKAEVTSLSSNSDEQTNEPLLSSTNSTEITTPIEVSDSKPLTQGFEAKEQISNICNKLLPTEKSETESATSNISQQNNLNPLSKNLKTVKSSSPILPNKDTAQRNIEALFKDIFETPQDNENSFQVITESEKAKELLCEKESKLEIPTRRKLQDEMSNKLLEQNIESLVRQTLEIPLNKVSNESLEKNLNEICPTVTNPSDLLKTKIIEADTVLLQESVVQVPCEDNFKIPEILNTASLNKAPSKLIIEKPAPETSVLNKASAAILDVNNIKPPLELPVKDSEVEIRKLNELPSSLTEKSVPVLNETPGEMVTSNLQLLNEPSPNFTSETVLSNEVTVPEGISQDMPCLQIINDGHSEDGHKITSQHSTIASLNNENICSIETFDSSEIKEKLFEKSDGLNKTSVLSSNKETSSNSQILLQEEVQRDMPCLELQSNVNTEVQNSPTHIPVSVSKKSLEDNEKKDNETSIKSYQDNNETSIMLSQGLISDNISESFIDKGQELSLEHVMPNLVKTNFQSDVSSPRFSGTDNLKIEDTNFTSSIEQSNSKDNALVADKKFEESPMEIDYTTSVISTELQKEETNMSSSNLICNPNVHLSIPYLETELSCGDKPGDTGSKDSTLKFNEKTEIISESIKSNEISESFSCNKSDDIVNTEVSLTIDSTACVSGTDNKESLVQSEEIIPSSKIVNSPKCPTLTAEVASEISQESVILCAKPSQEIFVLKKLINRPEQEQKKSENLMPELIAVTPFDAMKLSQPQDNENAMDVDTPEPDSNAEPEMILPDSIPTSEPFKDLQLHLNQNLTEADETLDSSNNGDENIIHTAFPVGLKQQQQTSYIVKSGEIPKFEEPTGPIVRPVSSEEIIVPEPLNELPFQKEALENINLLETAKIPLSSIEIVNKELSDDKIQSTVNENLVLPKSIHTENQTDNKIIDFPEKELEVINSLETTKFSLSSFEIVNKDLSNDKAESIVEEIHTLSELTHTENQNIDKPDEFYQEKLSDLSLQKEELIDINLSEKTEIVNEELSDDKTKSSTLNENLISPKSILTEDQTINKINDSPEKELEVINTSETTFSLSSFEVVNKDVSDDKAELIVEEIHMLSEPENRSLDKTNDFYEEKLNDSSIQEESEDINSSGATEISISSIEVVNKESSDDKTESTFIETSALPDDKTESTSIETSVLSNDKTESTSIETSVLSDDKTESTSIEISALSDFKHVGNVTKSQEFSQKSIEKGGASTSISSDDVSQNIVSSSSSAIITGPAIDISMNQPENDDGGRSSPEIEVLFENILIPRKPIAFHKKFKRIKKSHSKEVFEIDLESQEIKPVPKVEKPPPLEILLDDEIAETRTGGSVVDDTETIMEKKEENKADEIKNSEPATEENVGTAIKKEDDEEEDESNANNEREPLSQNTFLEIRNSIKQETGATLEEFSTISEDFCFLPGPVKQEKEISSTSATLESNQGDNDEAMGEEYLTVKKEPRASETDDDTDEYGNSE